MKSLHFFVLIGLGICASFEAIASPNTFVHHFDFDANNVLFSSMSHNGIMYSEPSYPNMLPTGEPGSPALPCTSITFQIPLGAINISVEASRYQKTNLPLNGVIMPIQEPISANEAPNSYPFTNPAPSIYGNSNNYPSISAELQGDGLLLGCNRLITVMVNPFEYSPQDNKLHIYQSIDLSISYEISSDLLNAFPSRPLVRHNTTTTYSSQESDASYSSPFSDNVIKLDSTIIHHDRPNVPELYTAEVYTPKAYQYTIITSQRLAKAFEPLVALRCQKGFDAGIVTMEEIKKSLTVAKGDVVSGINDDAGKLRAFLTYAFEHCNTEFVLLGGKEPDVPIRYGCSSIKNYAPDHINDEYSIPSDMYFSDLTSNWNSRGISGVYGQSTDKIDFLPELYVGRLLCNTTEQIQNYIDKVRIYELAPGNGDMNYLTKAFSGHGSTMAYMSDIIHENLSHAVSSIDYIKQKESEYYPKGADLVNLLNTRGPYGIYALHYHGNPQGVTTTDMKGPNGKKLPVYGLNALDAELHWLIEETGNGLDNIKNNGYPYIGYSMGCTLTPFDRHDTPETTTLNFGESMTLGKGYGGVAFLGNTRVGYYSPGNKKDRTSIYLENVFWDIVDSISPVIGIAEAISKRKDYTPLLNNGHHIRLTHNLIGDPLISMWTTLPYKQESVNTINSDTYISVISHTLGNGGRFIGIAPLNGDSPILYSASLAMEKISGISPNSVVTVYGKNILPCTAPLSIQNDTFTNRNYVFLSSLKIGRAVDRNRIQGAVVFTSGADFTFNASGNVGLYNGLEIRSGATINIISEGNVILDSITIDSQASLSVNCDTCKMSNLTIPKGASLIIQ